MQHLTKGHDDALTRKMNSTVPGMAHWAGGGPADAYCLGCRFYGYWKNLRNAAGEIVTSKFRKSACGKFHDLTGKHGADLVGNPSACRHFQSRGGAGAP
jgi:hypothetical protein